MSPLVSIIVPVYNVEPYLRACLDSILAQTYQNWEAVLVDDGSKDQSGTICDEYARRDPRFIVVHKQNEGVAKARITAFEHSKGAYITFIDSDDYVSSEYIEKLSKPIIEDGADMVSCNYFDYKVDEEKIYSNKKTLEGHFEGEQLQNFIAHKYFYDKKCRGFGMTNFLCTKMVRREFVEVGLMHGVNMWFGEDQTAMFAMLYKISCLCLIPDRLYYYVHYKGQATQKYDFSLWKSLITMFETYRQLDTKSIATDGLRKRTWLYVDRTISSKMVPMIDNKATFVSHLRMMRESPYMRKFFKLYGIGLGARANIKYWLLKLKLFRVYTFLLFAKNNRRTTL